MKSSDSAGVTTHRAGAFHLQSPVNHFVDTPLNLLALLVAVEQDGLVEIAIADVPDDAPKQAQLVEVSLGQLYGQRPFVSGIRRNLHFTKT